MTAAGNTRTATTVNVTVSNIGAGPGSWPPTASTKPSGTTVTDASGKGNTGTIFECDPKHDGQVREVR